MRGYEDEGMDALFRASPGDLIIGSKEDKRSTKTFISNEDAVVILEMIENKARHVIRVLQRLHSIDHGEELSPVECAKRYRGAKRWVEKHQSLVEHMASLQGFSVQAVVSMEKARWETQDRAESSIKQEAA